MFEGDRTPQPTGGLRGFVRRWRRLMITVLIGWALLIALLALLTLGPQTEPFIYQVF
ncbi:MAG: hypothetical protein AAGC60_03095 [Acidobacteriota bacterium]